MAVYHTPAISAHVSPSRPVEVYDSAAEFVAAQQRPPRKRAAARRPDIPRAPSGVGDRHAALAKLSKAGYGATCYVAATDEYYCIGPRGETPRCATYHAAIDAALAMVNDAPALPAVAIDRESTHDRTKG